MKILINLIITAVVYCSVPLIIRFAFKKSFNKQKSVLYSTLIWFIIKILVTLISNTDFSMNGWLYIIINYYILYSKENDNNEDIKNKPITEIENKQEEIVNEELLSILSDKDRIKNILDGKETINESLFVGIINPFNDKELKNIDDIKEYLGKYYNQNAISIEDIDTNSENKTVYYSLYFIILCILLMF